MDLFYSDGYFPLLLSIAIFFPFTGFSISATTFTFENKCDYTIWPGILAGAGSPNLDSTGFQLSGGGSRAIQAPPGWSGRFWARTGCNFDESGQGSCSTGDCGSGEVECNGAGANPPATLAEITVGGSKDFYDVSLVDGFNLPMALQPSGGGCAVTGCSADINSLCPVPLRVQGGGACKSACVAFGSPEYCCSGAYSSAASCKPSAYSEVFKSACPKAYSYAFDDLTSTFTCSAANYTITFCPNSPSLKSSMNSSATGSGSESGSGIVGGAVLADESWGANMATGGSGRRNPSSAVQFAVLLLLSLSSSSLFP